MSSMLVMVRVVTMRRLVLVQVRSPAAGVWVGAHADRWARLAVVEIGAQRPRVARMQVKVVHVLMVLVRADGILSAAGCTSRGNVTETLSNHAKRVQGKSDCSLITKCCTR